MAKKKQKQAKVNKTSTASNKVVPGGFPKEITQEGIEMIQAMESEVQELSPSLELSDEEVESLELTSDDRQSLDNAEAKGDVRQHIQKLKDITKRIRAIEKKTQEIKDRTEEDEKELKEKKEKTEKELEDERKRLLQATESLNKDRKKLLERELAVESGDYTSVIKSLLDSFEASEKEITSRTQSLVESMVARHADHLDDCERLFREQTQLNEDRKEVEKAKRLLEIEKKRYEAKMERDLFERLDAAQKDNLDKIQELEDRIFFLQGENDRQKQQLERLMYLRERLILLTGSETPEHLLELVEANSREISELTEELNSRPKASELGRYQTQVDQLTAEVNRLEEQLDEENLLRLKASFESQGNYIMQQQIYKARAEAAEARNDSYKDLVEDLQTTITQLRGKEEKVRLAFEASREMEKSDALTNARFNRRTPKDLKDLVGYLRAVMAMGELSEKKQCFFYEERTIRTFLAGLHMSPLSILQGISGTGKTSLPREMAKALVVGSAAYSGLDENYKLPRAPYRICSIQSGWRDNMDLMGHYNAFEEKYNETDFFKALFVANLPKYKDTLFLIILDEMNLSRPEHYFADFLSLLEQNEEERYITISAPETMLPESLKGGKMRIPGNVRFIGTANHDETTLEFADKTYDRSNVMNMPPNPNKVIKGTSERYSIPYTWLQDQFKKAEDDCESSYSKFWGFMSSKRIMELLREKGIGIGNRFEAQSKRFITAYVAMSSDPKVGLVEAVDHLISTRLLRRLRNRYDLDKNHIQNFQKDFTDLFAREFGGIPTLCNDLLNEEADKKQ